MDNMSYLQLYLDTDYILPVAVGADGNLVKYQSDDERRLWLYFKKSIAQGTFEMGKTLKANFEAKLGGCYGDFWNHLEIGDHVGNEPFQYVELLEVAGIVERLRTWCNVVLDTPTPGVVLNFSTTIGLKARKVFVDYLNKKGFAVRSYSTEINDLIAEKIVYDYRSSIHPAFGDQLLVIQSSGIQLLLSTLTWCGESFMQGEKPMIMEKQGEDFRRRELAKMAVDEIESTYGRLTTVEERESEIAFQMQFADKWYQSREGNIIRIHNFFYSHDPSDIKEQFKIDANQLDLRVEENSRITTDQIFDYYKKHVVNRHLHTIFFGDVFCDDYNGENVFRKRCVDVTNSQGKYTFFSDNALQEAMGRYYFSKRDVVEPVKELDRRYLTIEQERERIRKYVRNAETLGSLRSSILSCKEEMNSAIANRKAQTSSIEHSWKEYMKNSKFDQAEYVISEITSDNNLTQAFGQLKQALSSIEAKKSLLTDLKQLDNIHVQDVVEEIERGYKELLELQKEAKSLDKLPKKLHDLTKHYRDAYPTYKELMTDFESKTRAAKKRILDEIAKKDLTMENLPVTDIEKTTVELSCTLKQEKNGWLGLKKKKYIIVKMQVKDGKKLPCPCVLQISDSEIKVSRDGWYRDLDKGLENYEETIPVEAIKSTGNILKLLPNEEYSNLSTFIRCESINLNI